MLTPARTSYAFRMHHHANITALAAKRLVTNRLQMKGKASIIAGSRSEGACAICLVDQEDDLFQGLYVLGSMIAYDINVKCLAATEGVKAPKAKYGKKRRVPEHSVIHKGRASHISAIRQSYSKKVLMLMRLIQRSVNSMSLIDLELWKFDLSQFNTEESLSYVDALKQVRALKNEALSVASTPLPLP